MKQTIRPPEWLGLANKLIQVSLLRLGLPWHAEGAGPPATIIPEA